MPINLKPPAKPSFLPSTNPIQSWQNPVQDFLAPFQQTKTELEGKISQIASGNNPKTLPDTNGFNGGQFQGANSSNYQPQSLTDPSGNLSGEGSQIPNTILPSQPIPSTPYQSYAGKVDEKLNALPWYDPTKYIGKGIMGLSDMLSQKNDQGQPTGVPSAGLQTVSDAIKPITDEGVGNFIARKGQDIGNNMGNATVWDSTTLKDKVQKLIDKNPGITDDEIKAVMKNLKDNHNYVFSDNPLVKANSYIPTIGSVGSAIVKGVTGVAGGGTQSAMDLVSGMNNLDPHLKHISDAEANSQMVNSGLGLGMAGLGVAFPGTTAAFNTGVGEDLMGGKIPFVGKSVNDLNSMAGKWGLDTFTNLDPNSQEYKNYHSALGKILPMVATAGAGKVFKGGKSAIFGEDMNYQNGTVGDFVKSTGKTVDDFSSAMSELRPNTAGKFTENTKISDVFSPEEFSQLSEMAKQSGTPMRKEGMISDTTQANIGQKVGDIANSAVESVKGAKLPDLHISSSVGNAFNGLKDYVTGLDEKTKTAIKNTSPEEMNAIIANAKESVGQNGDYVQTPYHKGAQKAQQVLRYVDNNLSTRQGERMAMLDEAPVKEINLDEARQSFANSMKAMNVDNISVKNGEVFVKPTEGRESMFQSDNPSDVKAVEKLQEILNENVSPTQTMDRVRKLQEWVYENKTRIGFKGVSDKMENVLSRVQTSMNKTFKTQMPPEYAKVMDSMSEDMRLKNDIKKQFGVDEFGNTVGNRGELVMKRLANGTTTSGEARALAMKLRDKYGIDLIKEARLRQMAMDLVGDERGSTLFGAMAKGKRGMIDYAVEKTLGKIINKEKVIKKLAIGKKEVPKTQEKIFNPNAFKKNMASEVKNQGRLLPAPKSKGNGARNFRVNQPFDTSPKPQMKNTPSDLIKRPGGEVKSSNPVIEMKKAQEHAKMITSMKKDIASNTNAARYGGTGNTRIESYIESALANKKIDRQDAVDILLDIYDSVGTDGVASPYSYVRLPQLDEYITKFMSSDTPKIETFDDLINKGSEATPEAPKREPTPKELYDEINHHVNDGRFAHTTIDRLLAEFKQKTGRDPNEVSYTDFESDGSIKPQETPKNEPAPVVKSETPAKKEIIPKKPEAKPEQQTLKIEEKPAPKKEIIPKPKPKVEEPISKKETADMTVAEKIQAELDNKQATKEFKDVEDRVAGSRKEKALYRKLTMEDYKKVESESAALADDLVTKDRVIQDKYDPNADKEAGVPAGVSFIKEKLLSSLAKKPETGKEFRETYVQDAPDIYQQIADAKTLSEIKQIASDNFVMMHSRKGSSTLYKTEGKPMAESVLGKRFLDTLMKKTDGAKELWDNAELKNGLTPEELKIKKADEIQSIDKRYEDIKTRNEGTDYVEKAKKSMPYNMDYYQYQLKEKFSPSAYRNQSPEIVQKIADFIKNREKESLATFKEDMLQRFDENPLNKIREHDWTHLAKETKTPKSLLPKAEVDDTPKLHGNEPIKTVEREGGRDVTPEEVSSPEKIKELFGYKSAQFGNYMKDSDSQTSIRNFVGAMKDLEDITGLDIKGLNDKEGLSIAFGARGQGGRAAAHYEPKYNIINLTKGHGNGTVAHEFGHFLDFTAGKAHGMMKGGFPDAISGKEPEVRRSFGLIHSVPEEAPLVKAMQNVISTIKGEGKTFEKNIKFKENPSGYKYPNIERMFNDKGVKETVDYVNRQNYKEADKVKIFEYIAKLNGGSVEVNMRTKGTRYFSDANTLGKKYWGSNVELFARAFEAYIQDLGEEKGIRSNYLVAENNHSITSRKHGELHPYPLGMERARINEAIDEFMTELRKTLGTQKEGFKPRTKKSLNN